MYDVRAAHPMSFELDEEVTGITTVKVVTIVDGSTVVPVDRVENT